MPTPVDHPGVLGILVVEVPGEPGGIHRVGFEAQLDQPLADVGLGQGDRRSVGDPRHRVAGRSAAEWDVDHPQSGLAQQHLAGNVLGGGRPHTVT